MSPVSYPRAKQPPPPKPQRHRDVDYFVTRWSTWTDGRRTRHTKRFRAGSITQALTQYRSWLRLWHADPRVRCPGMPEGCTVLQLAGEYKAFAKATFIVRGRPSSHVTRIGTALDLLCDLYGNRPAAEMTPPDLAAYRDSIVQNDASGLRGRATVNAYLSAAKKAFRWGAERGLIPAPVSAALREVAWLSSRATTAPARVIESVALARVKATVEHLEPHLAAMVWLQWHTGMRPDEVCSMEGRLIDRRPGESVWLYRPEHHKLAHHGQAREIQIGPPAQAVLAPYLRRLGYLFRPRDAGSATTAAGRRYTSASYRRAVSRACEAAGVPAWHPNQLRHAFASRVKRQLGIDAARAALGHTTADTTQLYLDRDRELARRVALEVG